MDVNYYCPPLDCLLSFVFIEKEVRFPGKAVKARPKTISVFIIPRQ